MSTHYPHHSLYLIASSHANGNALNQLVGDLVMLGWEPLIGESTHSYRHLIGGELAEGELKRLAEKNPWLTFFAIAYDLGPGEYRRGFAYIWMGVRGTFSQKCSPCDPQRRRIRAQDGEYDATWQGSAPKLVLNTRDLSRLHANAVTLTVHGRPDEISQCQAYTADMLGSSSEPLAWETSGIHSYSCATTTFSATRPVASQIFNRLFSHVPSVSITMEWTDTAAGIRRVKQAIDGQMKPDALAVVPYQWPVQLSTLLQGGQ
jgi:hypothetical protein